MLTIDNSWSSWVIALSLILNATLITLSLFKKQIGAILPESVANLFRLTVSEQDHEQDVEKALIDSQLQSNATGQLQQSRREDRYMTMLSQKDKYLYGFLNKKVDQVSQTQEATRKEVAELRKDLQAGFSATREDQKAILTAIGQTNTLLKELTITITNRRLQ